MRHADHADRVPILLVEDDDNDVLFMQLAFKRARMPNPLIALHDGAEAMDYLSGIGNYANQGRSPCLILTDLKMPRMDGFDLLAWIRGRPTLSHIPVIVLSSSNQPEDRRRALELGARDYWVKPSEIQTLMRIVEQMRNTWIPAHCA
jgi:CheY-like chemotaxis protein